MTEIKKLKLSEINLHEAIRFTNDFVFKAIFTNPDDNCILLRRPHPCDYIFGVG